MNIQDSFQELLAAENTVKTRLADLRMTISDSVRSKSLPGVKPIRGSVNCCVVSFSTIAGTKNLCLTPQYYLPDSQAEAVGYVLASKQTASAFLAALADMIHNGYAKVRGGDKIPLNDETMKVLRQTFNNLNM